MSSAIVSDLVDSGFYYSVLASLGCAAVTQRWCESGKYCRVKRAKKGRGADKIS